MAYVVEVVTAAVASESPGGPADRDLMELRGRLAGIEAQLESVPTGQVADRWARAVTGRAEGLPPSATSLRMVGLVDAASEREAVKAAADAFLAQAEEIASLGRFVGEPVRATAIASLAPLEVHAAIADLSRGRRRAHWVEFEAGRPLDPDEFAAVLDVGLEPRGRVGGLAVFAREAVGGSHHGVPTRRGAYHAWDRCRTAEERPPYGAGELVGEVIERLNETLGRPPTRFEINQDAAARVGAGADPRQVASMADVERAANLVIGAVRAGWGLPALDVTFAGRGF